jgi:hypothetical protein
MNLKFSFFSLQNMTPNSQKLTITRPFSRFSTLSTGTVEKMTWISQLQLKSRIMILHRTNSSLNLMNQMFLKKCNGMALIPSCWGQKMIVLSLTKTKNNFSTKSLGIH